MPGSTAPWGAAGRDPGALVPGLVPVSWGAGRLGVLCADARGPPRRGERPVGVSVRRCRGSHPGRGRTPGSGACPPPRRACPPAGGHACGPGSRPADAVEDTPARPPAGPSFRTTPRVEGGL